MSKILIVDDERVILDNLEELLEEFIDEIIIYNNSYEALEYLSQTPVDCVILDINMPRIDGIEFLKIMRKNNLNLPVIFFTGHANMESYIEKDENLIAVIRKTEFLKLEDILLGILNKQGHQNA